MRRHFVEHRDFEVSVATTAEFCVPGIPSLKLKRATWLQRLSNTRFVRFVRNFELLFYGTLLGSRVLDEAKEFRPDVVFTVADMTLSEQARKLAKCLGVPLVVNFQDWWPRGQFYYTFEKPYFWVRPLLEWRFRRLYREADLAFCTSEGMKEFLGPHPNSHVLYPIGASDAEASCPMRVAPEDRRSEIEDRGAATLHTGDRRWEIRDREAQGSKLVPSSATGMALDSGRLTLDAATAKLRKKRLIYTGTAFGSYGKMLRELARELEKHDEWELVIFGNTPDWPKEELERAKEAGLYRGLLKFEELQRELHEADACLGVMSFEPELEVMMRTSFTTKMLDYCRIGKPLILWGPEYCSPIRLAIRAGAGLCVVNNDPNILVDALKTFDKYIADNKITKGAKYLSKNDLNHSCIHNVLVSNIVAVVR